MVAQCVIVAALATAWRVYLSSRYYGWEESDYGNLYLSQLAIESGFTWFKPAYMPGYYLFGGVVRLLIRDPQAALTIVTMGWSVCATVCATALSRRLSGAGPSWMVAFLLAFQPDWALQSASTLRYPVLGATAIIAPALAIWGFRRSAICVSGYGILVHHLGAIVFPVAHLLGEAAARRERSAGLAEIAGIFILLLGGWQIYVTGVHGEGLFILGPLQANAGSDDWTVGLGIHNVTVFLTWLLPRKLGVTWVLLVGIGLLSLLNSGMRSHRSLGVWWAALAVSWLGQGFLTTYDLNHNLFWGRLLPLVPLSGVLAALGVRRIMDLTPRRCHAIVVVALAASVVPAFASETRYQLERSEALYRPQIEHASWLETNLQPGTVVMVSAIPEVWFKRQPSPLRVMTFSDVPVETREAGPLTTARYLRRRSVRFVWWFREEWTEAPLALPFLGGSTPVVIDGVGFVPLDREDAYGWTLYGVVWDGAPMIPTPPVRAQGPGR